MNLSWPWGNYWNDPDWDALTPDPPGEPTVEITDPEPGLLGPDGDPLPTGRVPVGFARPIVPAGLCTSCGRDIPPGTRAEPPDLRCPDCTKETE